MTNRFSDATRSTDAFLYLPSRAGRVAVEEFTRRNTADVRLGWGIDPLDDYLIPQMPGDLTTIVARPGHCKTTMMIYLSRIANHALKQRAAKVGDDQEKRFVVYATWETLVEEFVAIWTADTSGFSLEDIGRGKASVPGLQKAIGTTIMERIAAFGKSMGTATGLSPDLDDLDTVLTDMRDKGTPAAICMVDYLQRLPGPPGKERQTQVSENLERLKDLALKHRIPMIAGVQAKREVDDYSGLKFPKMSDGQWSSNIEQTSDKILALTRPITYLEPNKPVDVGGVQYAVTQSSLGLRVLKQRWGRAGKTFMLDVDPGSMLVSMAEPLKSAF
jgi:replicative DNA helicase